MDINDCERPRGLLGKARTRDGSRAGATWGGSPRLGLQIEDLSVRLGRVSVLSRVSLRVAPAEQVALIGPSGAGKSTLLRLVAGFIVPDRGMISWNDETWSSAGAIPVAPRRRCIGMVTQDLALWPHLTARAHLSSVLRLRGSPWRGRRAAVDQALAAVGLTERASHRPAALSGGEGQRLALARALAGGSRLLLLDEPFGQLDVALSAELSSHIARLAETSGVAVMQVTHNPTDALQGNHRVVVLEDGRIIQDATPRRLLDAPASRFVAAVVGRTNWIPAERTQSFLHAIGAQPGDDRFVRLPNGSLACAPDALELAETGLMGVLERTLILLARDSVEVQAGADRLRLPGRGTVGTRVRIRASAR